MSYLSKCPRCRSALETGDLRCPVCFQAVPPATEASSTAVRVQVLRCGTCGAAMEYRAGTQALQCAFCGGVLRLEEQIDPVEQIERYLPFTVDPAQARDIYRAWISRQGFFRPWNLASAARRRAV